MPMTHVPEICAENLYQKNGTINRHENTALSYSLPKTGTRKIRYQIARRTRQKPRSVFGADFWYVCHWHAARPTTVLQGGPKSNPSYYDRRDVYQVANIRRAKCDGRAATFRSRCRQLSVALLGLEARPVT